MVGYGNCPSANILQPRVAILGMGGLFIDSADADKFMVAARNYLENWSEEIG